MQTVNRRLLTPAQLYVRKQRVWRMYQKWAKQIIRAFFPDTKGSGHLMHNWYRCDSTRPDLQKLADWVLESTCARERRLVDRIEARARLNEHLLNHGVHFSPSWCDYCEGKLAVPTRDQGELL